MIVQKRNGVFLCIDSMAVSVSRTGKWKYWYWAKLGHVHVKLWAKWGEIPGLTS